MAANKVTAAHRLAPPAKDYSEPSEWKLGGSFLLPGSIANPFKRRIYLSATRRYSQRAFFRRTKAIPPNPMSPIGAWVDVRTNIRFAPESDIPEGRRLIQTRLGA
jgi:hypothetical protein